MFDPFSLTAIAIAVAAREVYRAMNSPSSTSTASPTTTSTPKIERQKHVVFIGKTNSGKSTLANALFNTDFTVGPTHGVTSMVQRRYFGDNYWQAVDTPGILDTTDYSCTVLNAVEESKLAVFVTTGQMLRDEHEFLRRVWYKSYGYGVIVFVNKLDTRNFNHTSREIEIENELIRNQVREVSEHIPVISGSASPIRYGQRWQAEIQELQEEINERISVL